MNEFQHMAPLDGEQLEKIVEDQLLLYDKDPKYFLERMKLPPDFSRGQAKTVIEHIVVKDKDHCEIWRNDTYQVAIYNRDERIPNWPRLIHLSIKRIDREIIRDWRELQEIKNRLIGRENEAVELFPAESRRVDLANQYHLYVLADPKIRFPFGFTEGFVADHVEGSLSKQRPLT